MRSLKELDAELVRHNLLFGRGVEKQNLCRHLMADERGVLLYGTGGMGKTTLMLHALRDLGGMVRDRPSALTAVQDSGHSFYFEDLEAFVRFLGVRKRPLTLLRAAITFRWDVGGERKECTVQIKGRGGQGADMKGTPIAASSSMLQAERLIVRTTLDAAFGPRFDIEEIIKRVDPVLVRFSEGLGRAVESARREQGEDDRHSGHGPDGAGGTVPARLATALAGIMDGSVQEGDREHGIVLNFLEEELAALVEDCNREVYLSASSFLRPDEGPVRKLSLREFEDALQGFLENANLDGLVPGELTFWRWYIGVDHLERGVPGWTLDVKRQAVRMVFERLSEKDGFHVVMAIEPNPALIIDHANQGGGFDKEGDDLTAMQVSMPPREEFVREASSFIVENVDGLNGLRRAGVQKVMANLYDHCRGRVRLYYLIRSIKNLPALEAQGVEQVEPDASFLDRQLGDALGQLGVRYEYDMSIKNLPTVQPLIELARIEEHTSREGQPIASKNVVAWLLDVYDNDLALGVERYLHAMEAYGIVRVTGDQVGFFDPYVGWELRLLSRSMEAGDRPLQSSFQSTNRLNRFLAVLEQGDLLAISAHVAAVLSNWSATSKADPGIYSSLLAALDGGGDFPERRRKIAILTACGVLGGASFSAGQEDDQRMRVAELFRSLVPDNDHDLTSLMSRALKRLTDRDGGRKCAFCGSSMVEGQSICTACRSDYRELCPSCGEKVSPHFAYCAGCGSKVVR